MLNLKRAGNGSRHKTKVDKYLGTQANIGGFCVFSWRCLFFRRALMFPIVVTVTNTIPEPTTSLREREPHVRTLAAGIYFKVPVSRKQPDMMARPRPLRSFSLHS